MIITKKLSNKCLNFIKNNTSISEEDLEKIYYGIQVILLNMSKLILLFTTAYLLGILKYTVIAFIVFAILRTFASGVHANSTLQCIIINFILFLGNVYLSLNLSINIIVQSIIFTISFILILLYAPGDTEERPLVSKKLRRDLKIKSLVVVIIFYIIILLIKSNVYANLITYSILEAYAGAPVTDAQQFVLAVNNYRQSGGGGFPAVASAPVVYNRQDEIRQLIIEWVQAHGVIDPAQFASQDWRLVSGGQPIQVD